VFKKKSILYLSRFAIIAAILYCIPVIFFLKSEKFSQTWLLYLGNALFLFCLFIFGILYGSKNNNLSKRYNGFTVTILGVIFSCILIFVLIFIFAPGIFNIGSSNGVLQQTPAAITKKNNHGIIFILFADAIIGNVTAGSFSTVFAKSESADKSLPE
jgi:hypothetical protein